jgi:GNAT superfamily N-acetyltransferase
MPTIYAIDEQSPHLESVKGLWRSHSATLGFLPEGAFQDYARERHVVVALDDNDACVGYLLYRIVRDKVAIAHFCVAPACRRNGYARAMLNWLIKATKKQRGIMLSCRNDFEASKSWPRLGFYPIGRKVGRAGDITIWWQGHGHSDLFTANEPTVGMRAAFDANVFLDLMDKRDEETQGLLADWLAPFLTLCYTAELLIEINRQHDPATQARRRAEAEQFQMLDCSAEAFHKAEQVLLPFLPQRASEQDESDFRHLVRALAAEADVFVTRDEELLSKAEAIFDACGLAVVRPGELVTQIDSLQQGHLYKRTQIAGTNQIFRSRLTEVGDELIAAVKAGHEKHHEVRRPLGRYLADPHRFHCHQIRDREGALLAVYVIGRQPKVHEVPVFRVCDKRRAATLTRAILTHIVRDAAAAGIGAVLITDQEADALACADLGFLPVNQGQLKLILSGWFSIEQVPSMLAWDDPQVAKIEAALPAARTDAVIASELEHILWPAKLSDSAIPSFLAPIKARFAEHLFDYRLAAGSLFGADVDLALNPESAYYRAARPGIASPARVLWYVCRSDNYCETMSIRACSRIVEVVKGTPKLLFKRFRRLGVYEWADLMQKAGDAENEIMAFRFDDTELLRPLNWNEFQPILKAHDVHTTLQSPIEIPAEVFGELYVAALDSSSLR